MTDQYAVIGHPIAHSRSPRIHAMFARQTGQDISYRALLAPPDGFAACVRDFIEAGGRGANVTLPFKQEACRLATRLSEAARLAGAVNTLRFEAQEIFGDNTDGAGLVRDLRHNLGRTIAGARILLLGAGGAARGVILPLLQEHPERLLIANRTAQKARILAEQFNGELPCRPQACGLDELGGNRFDMVINATSAGLSAAPLDIPGSVFASDCLAYEMVYGKLTPFMAQAGAAAAEVCDGLGMLVEQAAAAFFIWRGIQPDTAPVLQVLRSK